MAKGTFLVGFTVAEILQILENHKKILIEVKTVKSWSEGATQVSKEFGMPLQEVIDECNYALRIRDPDNYGRRRRVSQSVVPPFIPL